MRQRYGPWALVAGASEGIGAAFATALAAHRLDLVLVARRRQPLAALVERLTVRTITVCADLADGVAPVLDATAGLEIGLVVCNAAYAPIGAFLDTGAVATPGLGRSTSRAAPGTVTPQQVASTTLAALGHRPRTVPGVLMKLSAAMMARLLPRRTAINVMARANRAILPG